MIRKLIDSRELYMTKIIIIDSQSLATGAKALEKAQSLSIIKIHNISKNEVIGKK